jgi:hypothetical protein
MNGKLNAIQCPKCCDVVFSRARHDMRQCSCGAVAIDGGASYTKVSFEPGYFPFLFEIELVGKMFLDNLFQDWNQKINALGLIKKQDVVYPTLYRYTLNSKGEFRRHSKF